MTVLLYPLLTAALYYLGSRAKITEWLWTRYSTGFASIMDCAACTGFWYGLCVESAFGCFRDAMDLATTDYVRMTVAAWVAGLCSIVWTPIVAALMQHSLTVLGSAVDVPAPEGDPPQ